MSGVEIIEAAERQFLDGFDPFFHYVLLEHMSSGSIKKIEVDCTEEEFLKEDFRDEIAASSSRISDSASALARVFRFFVSETMILFLLSGRPFSPFVRVASTLRYEELNSVFEDLSSRRVPKGFELTSAGAELDFVAWVSHRITLDPSWIVENGYDDLAELIAEEASLLSRRGVINAFKHGKPFSQGQAAEIVLLRESGERVALSDSFRGINWIDWKETTELVSLHFHTEETDFNSDLARIFVVSLVNRAIKNVRMAQIKSLPIAAQLFPNDFPMKLFPKRQSHKVEILRRGAQK